MDSRRLTWGISSEESPFAFKITLLATKLFSDEPYQRKGIAGCRWGFCTWNHQSKSIIPTLSLVLMLPGYLFIYYFKKGEVQTPAVSPQCDIMEHFPNLVWGEGVCGKSVSLSKWKHVHVADDDVLFQISPYTSVMLFNVQTNRWLHSHVYPIFSSPLRKSELQNYPEARVGCYRSPSFQDLYILYFYILLLL